MTLSPAEMAEILQCLKTARHNVNNSLSLVTAAAELVKLKPDAAERFSNQILQQPQRIMAELRQFSDDLEKRLGVEKD